MIEVTFNGVNLSNFARIVDVRMDVLAPRKIYTLDVPKRDGAYVFGKKAEPRFFEVDLMIVEDVHFKRASLARLFDTEVAVPLEFSFHPGIEYYAIVTGDTMMDQPIQKIARFTIQFMVPEPYGYGDMYAMTIPANVVDGVGDVSVFGDAKVYPEISVTLLSDATSIALTNGTDYMQIGIPKTPEKAAVPREQLVFNDAMGSTTGWSALSGTLEDGTMNGTLTTNGYSFQLGTKGTGSNWHGGALAKPLPESLQDFVFQAKVRLSSEKNAEMGKIDIYFRNAAGEQVAKMTMKDDVAGSKSNRMQSAIGFYGQRRIITDKYDTDFAPFSGLFRMRREGNMIRTQFAQQKDGKTVSSFSESVIDTAGLFDDAITSVVIAMSAHGTANASFMAVEDVKFWKVNALDTSVEVDEVFHTGDVLRIDMESGAIYLNEVNAIKYMQPGSRFFGLNPPIDSIGVAPEGIATTSVVYRSRWY